MAKPGRKAREYTAEEKRQRGACRPMTLTPEVQEAILQKIREGNFLTVAAKAVGISRRTITSWMTNGRRSESGPYRDFLVAMMNAECEAEADAVKTILEAGKHDPKCKQWWLERKFPQRWGSQSRFIRELESRLVAMEKAYVGLLEDTRKALLARAEAPATAATPAAPAHGSEPGEPGGAAAD